MTMFDFAVFAEETEDNSAYWEYVREIQKEIRTNRIGRYGMIPIYGRDITDGTYEIEALSNSQYFRITKAELIVKDGEMTARITIPSMSYLYVYMGTAKDAAVSKKSEQIGFQEVNNQTVFTVPVEALDKKLISRRSARPGKSGMTGKWFSMPLLCRKRRC